MRTRHTRKLIASALGLIVLGCIWFYLAPAAIGGSTTYVVTDGISMEPRFHTGDLALVRGKSSYHVGEIVAYHSKMFHTIVLHRIVGRDGSRYLFKGDNNNFVDFEHPASSQLIGALWVHVPGAGATLESIRSPALVGLLAAIGTILLSGTAFVRRRRRRRRQRRAGESAPQRPARPPRAPRAPFERPTEQVVSVLAVGLATLAPFVLLALLAFTRPSTTLRTFAVPYKQSGRFSYSGEATPGPTYAGNRVVTGEPLFTHVLRTVGLRFSYAFSSAAKHSLSGHISLAATIEATNGWRTTLQLAPPRAFRGDHAQVAAPLDLASLLALVHRVEDATGMGTTSYTMTLLPQVSASASVNDVPEHLAFSPQIPFSLSELEVQPIVSSKGSAAAGASASTFAPSTESSVTGKRSRPLYLSFKVVRLSVASARWIALGGMAIVICALLAALALVRLRPRERNQSASIRARYGRLIVPVERVWPLPGVAVIDVTDMDALARIAEHYERSILHETLADGEAFWVTDESGQFRYAPCSDPQPAPDEAPVASEAPIYDPAHDVSAGRLVQEPPTLAFERRPAAVAVAADQPTEQHRTTAGVERGAISAVVERSARDAIVDAGESASAAADRHAGEELVEGDRVRARAAFASITGLRWTIDS